ncbi:MAG: lysophospholipid acyltransferase family protein [Candidatus Binatia bacterium]|nr:lysophospholipid acyltransferase family protein [Candidatus Binatia bacterium]
MIAKIWLWFFRWEVEGPPPGVPKGVVVAYPHTSNWDFTFALAVGYYHRVDIRWLGKSAMFNFPFGWFFRWLGGIPVDRSKATGLVDSVVETIHSYDELLIVIPPEGTRGQSGRWKSGFYWIAVRANVPIVLSYLDYTRRRGGLGTTINPTGDIEADFEKIRDFYDGVLGKYPEKQVPISLLDPAP